MGDGWSETTSSSQMFKSNNTTLFEPGLCKKVFACGQKPSDAVEESQPFPAANSSNTDLQNGLVPGGSQPLGCLQGPAPESALSSIEPPRQQDVGRGKASVRPQNSHALGFRRSHLQVRCAESPGREGKAVIKVAAGTGREEKDSV